MGERLDDSASNKKMKKLEKPQVSSNREYLDMDTDEEEYGRQETPEPEEEQELEPDKPVFTEEELNTLVRYVKDFVTLPGITDAIWSRDVIELTEEYFRSPANTVLTIFWETGTLRALLDFPVRMNAGGLTYFLRAPWQIYNPENFLSTIVFGTVGGRIENSTLKFMENMYAPIAFHSDEWPAVMRNETLSSLHKFILCLTDATYEPMGLTIFYVPREGLLEDNLIHINEVKDQGLIERLEQIARYWIKKIREALKGTTSFPTFSPCRTIVDEIRYWHYRYENLSGVHQQLTNRSVIMIIKKLESVGSSSVKQYTPLISEVREILNESASNISYLNLLEHDNKSFDIPDGVEEYATRILYLIKFIGTESPHYNTSEKIATLCQAFCTQVVEHLSTLINLSIVLDGNANAGREMLVRCLASCDKFSRTFDRIVDMDRSMDTATISQVDKSKVFNHMNTFVHRCNNLVEIVDARIAFDKCAKPILIGGPKGPELGLDYQSIEERFHIALNEIKVARDEILDIVSSAWLKRIEDFKRDINDIENMVKNWIHEIFNDVSNVEEGIEALHAIERFSSRPNLRETLKNKWIQVWKMFDEELESTLMLMCKNLSNFQSHPSLPPFSGYAHILRSWTLRLTRRMKILVDASDWFGDCDAQKPIARKYKRVLAAISEREETLFDEWQKELLNFSILSSMPILRYHDDTKMETITVNLETLYLDHLKEISEWTTLNYETKNILPKDCPRWRTLKSRYNKVLAMCKLYNSIFLSVIEIERFLFLTMMNELEDTMSSGFNKTTWLSDSFERFFMDCMDIMTKVQESLEAFRNINARVADSTETIESMCLVNFEANAEEMIEDSKIFLEHESLFKESKKTNTRESFMLYRQNVVTIVIKECKQILKLLSELKSSINLEEEQTVEYLDAYVHETYEYLKESIATFQRLSLQFILQFFHRDELTLTEAEQVLDLINTSFIIEAIPVSDFDAIFAPDTLSSLVDHCEKDPESISLKNQISGIFRPPPSLT